MIVFARRGFVEPGEVGYRYRGIEYRYQVPIQPPAEDEEHLLQTGYFKRVTQEEAMDMLDHDVLDEPLPQPKNSLAGEDLSEARILMRRLGGIGDVVFVGAIAQTIKAQAPDCKITMAVRQDMMPLVEQFKCVDSVTTFEDSLKLELFTRYQFLLDFNNTLEHNPESMKRDYYEIHLERAGLPKETELHTLEVSFSGDVEGEYKSWLEGHGISEGEYVVAQIGTSNPLKRYPNSAWKKVCESLASPAGATVVVLGSGRDRPFHTMHPRIVMCLGKGLDLAARVVAGAKAYLGTDTGFLHLAGNLSVPTLSLWGMTNSKLTLPRYENAHFIQSSTDCPKSPCLVERPSWCHRNNGVAAQCMRDISSAEVLSVAKERLDLSWAEFREPGVASRANITGTGEIEIDTRMTNILMFLEGANRYTGGGTYFWALGLALGRREDVRVYMVTDNVPVYANDWEDKLSDFQVVIDHDFATWEKRFPAKFDVVIGSPLKTGLMAAEYGLRHGTKVVLTMYETPNYIAEYREGKDGQDAYWTEFVGAIAQAERVILISPELMDAFAKWQPDYADKTHLITPCINSELLRNAKKVSPDEREHAVAMIARNVWYKGLETGISALAEIEEPPKLYLIGDGVRKLQKTCGTDLQKLDVEFLENIPDRQKFEILNRCRAFLFPSDFEGFGIPPAEAMWCGTPVVAFGLPVLKTVYRDHITYVPKDGLKDAVEELLAKYPKKRAAGSRGFMHVSVSYKQFMRTATGLLSEIAPKKESVIEAVEEKPTVAMVTTWNERCGIAENTAYFAKRLGFPLHVFAPRNVDGVPIATVWGDDESNVVRDWTREFNTAEILMSDIRRTGAPIVHFQHEFSFYKNEPIFRHCVSKLQSEGRKVIVTFHTYAMGNALIEDMKNQVDCVTTTKHIPHFTDGTKAIAIPLPVPESPDRDKLAMRVSLDARRAEGDFTSIPVKNKAPFFKADPGRPVIATHGYWQVHKGYREMITCIDTWRERLGENVLVLIVGKSAHKSQYAAETRWYIEKNDWFENVALLDKYLPLDVVVECLQAADVIVYNYMIKDYVSSSAAVRTGMMAHRPIAVADGPFFTEFDREVLRFSYADREDMAETVATLVEDKARQQSLVQAADAYIANCTPDKIARRYESLYQRVLKGE